MIDDPRSAPSDEATLERCCRLVNVEMHAAALQQRRLATPEPEDNQFVLRWWVDLQFLILTLLRFRRVARLVLRTRYASAELEAVLAAFDTATPHLRTMRNIGEHADAYAVDNPTRHRIEIRRHHLEAGSWDGRIFYWLDCVLDVDAAVTAAADVHTTLQAAKAQAAKEMHADPAG